VNFQNVGLPVLQVDLESTVMHVNAGHHGDPRQTNPMNPADDAVEQRVFESGAVTLKCIQLEMVVFVVQHGDATNQPQQHGNRENGPMEAHDRCQRCPRNRAKVCRHAADAIGSHGLFGFIENPSPARNSQNTHCNPR